jgi:hypothetical protein
VFSCISFWIAAPRKGLRRHRELYVK